MLDKIEEYIRQLFSEIESTKQSEELKDELLINLTEKYNDQIQQGKTPQEAYHQVISGIGDLSELIQSVSHPSRLSSVSGRERKRSASRIAFSVILYIISPFVMILIADLGNTPTIGIFMMFLLIAVATGCLIYNQMVKPKYRKVGETIVEEFKEWRSVKQNRKSAYFSLKIAFWSAVTVIYLAFNFIFMIWDFSWFLFVFAFAVWKIIELIMKSEGGEK